MSKSSKTSKVTKKQSNGFCFTINNYDDDDIAAIMALYKEDINCKYCIVGFEKGRKKTHHMQCYVYYTNKLTKGKFEKLLHNVLGHTVHSEVQKAKSNVAAYVYCMEDYNFYEMGDRPRQGHRTDLESIKHDLHNGKSVIAVSKDYFSQWCQYRRAFDEYVKIHGLEDKHLGTILLYDDGNEADKFVDYYTYMRRNYRIKLMTTQTIYEALEVSQDGGFDFILYPLFFSPEHYRHRFQTLHSWFEDNVLD